MSEYLYYLIKNSSVVFWDFDGVIKDSVDIKSIAFEKLFSIYGTKISKKVRAHHEKNAGVSRFDKIPLYMSWSNELVMRVRSKVMLVFSIKVMIFCMIQRPARLVTQIYLLKNSFG